MKGGMQGVLKQVQKMQDEMQKVKESLGEKTVTAESGGGMVKVTANGNNQITSLVIDPQVVIAAEKEILEDLIISAVNKAIESATKMSEEEMGKVSKGFIPPGFNIPGLF